MDETPFFLKERARSARENLATLLFIVIFLGVAIGLVTNLVSTYVIDEESFWPWLIGALFVAASITAYIIYFLYSRGNDAEVKLDLVLPFRVTSAEVKVAEAPPYPITRDAHHAVAACLKGDDQDLFLKEWRQRPSEPFNGFVLDSAMDLVTYLILCAYQEYAKVSLRPSATYFKHRWIYHQIESQEIPQQEWPSDIRSNIFVKNLGTKCFQSITVPRGVKLQFVGKRQGEKLFSHEVQFKSEYGTITVAISPYPAKVNQISKSGKIMSKYCGVSEKTEMFIVQLPLRIIADFYGLSIFRGKFHQVFLPWSMGLLESLHQQLDWNECMAKDLERMVVELRGKLEQVAAKQGEPKT